MLLASSILLIIAAMLLFYDAVLMFTGKPNPLKGLPLPCPVTLIVLGLGILLLSINYFVVGFVKISILFRYDFVVIYRST